MYSRRFGVPLTLPVMTLVVALELIQLVTADDDGLDDEPPLYSAATPATCGVAIDVPLIVFVREPSHADLIATPGA